MKATGFVAENDLDDFDDEAMPVRKRNPDTVDKNP